MSGKEKSELKGYREVALARLADCGTSLKWGHRVGRGSECPRKEHSVMKGEALSAVVICWAFVISRANRSYAPQLVFIVIVLFLF